MTSISQNVHFPRKRFLLPAEALILEAGRIASAQMALAQIDLQDLVHPAPESRLDGKQPLRYILMDGRFAHLKVRRTRTHRAARLDHVLRTTDGPLPHLIPHRLVPPPFDQFILCRMRGSYEENAARSAHFRILTAIGPYDTMKQRK